MTQDSNKRVRPKWTGLMVGWLVFLGFYQPFLAAQHGGFFLGQNNLLRQDVSSTDLVILYIVMGVLFLILAYAAWTMQWWAFPLGLVIQGMVIAVALEGVFRWLLLGQPAPLVWDALDLIFAAINLAWLLSREVRTAYMNQ
jgi:uncharacterized membrane protein